MIMAIGTGGMGIGTVQNGGELAIASAAVALQGLPRGRVYSLGQRQGLIRRKGQQVAMVVEQANVVAAAIADANGYGAESP